METINLEFKSDENLVIFHAEAFMAIYRGESGYESLPQGVRSTAVKQGLLCRNYFPSKQRLTEKAIGIMRENGLLDLGSDRDEPKT